MLDKSMDEKENDLQSISMFVRNDGTLTSVTYKRSNMLRAEINTKNCFGTHWKKRCETIITYSWQENREKSH